MLCYLFFHIANGVVLELKLFVVGLDLSYLVFHVTTWIEHVFYFLIN